MRTTCYYGAELLSENVFRVSYPRRCLHGLVERENNFGVSETLLIRFSSSDARMTDDGTRTVYGGELSKNSAVATGNIQRAENNYRKFERADLISAEFTRVVKKKKSRLK